MHSLLGKRKSHFKFEILVLSKDQSKLLNYRWKDLIHLEMSVFLLIFFCSSEKQTLESHFTHRIQIEYFN